MTNRHLIRESDYEILSDAEQAAVCQEILGEIATGRFTRVGHTNQEHWGEVWRASQGIVPDYVRPGQFLRVNRQFVRPLVANMELLWYQEFRAKVMESYFQEVGSIYEFGCGNGWNLRAARLAFPGKNLVGLDFASSAVDQLQSRYSGDGWNIDARQFDFKVPDHNLDLPTSTAVWTVGALEQTGKDWEPFLQFLLEKKPAVCVHIEPILEWYHRQNPVDQTAIAYHRARGYWEGFPNRIQQLVRRGKAKVLTSQRSNFGSKYIEGYSLFVWKVL